MNEKEIIAAHILDLDEKKKFLAGNAGEYTITGLDFSKIPNYNFNDGNNYRFVSCILNNISVSFVNEFIYFSNPLIDGKVKLHNEGVGDEDLIMIDYVDCGQNLSELSVESAFVGIFESVVHPAEALSFVAEEITIEKCKLESKSFPIDFLNLCEVRNSEINGASFKEEIELIIERSYINGTFVYFYKDSQDFRAGAMYINGIGINNTITEEPKQK